jgi:hypothetical protein
MVSSPSGCSFNKAREEQMTSTDKGSPAGFCASLEWDEPRRITWLDMTGYIELDDDRRARLQLAELRAHDASYPTSGYLTGFEVEIVSKTRGRLDGKTFLFDDYLDERADNRADVRPQGGTFKVISRVGWSWYLAVPATTRPFTSAVERYLELFR